MAKVIFVCVLGLILLGYGHYNRQRNKRYRDKKFEEFKCKHNKQLIDYLTMIGGTSGDNNSNKHGIHNS